MFSVFCPKLNHLDAINLPSRHFRRRSDQIWFISLAQDNRTLKHNTTNLQMTLERRRYVPCDYDPGCRIKCWQIHVGCGPVPRGLSAWSIGRPVQTAKHVQQCRCHGRWRRNRPRTGIASLGRKRAPTQRYEPRFAKARNRCRRTGHCSGQTHDHHRRARLLHLETPADRKSR